MRFHCLAIRIIVLLALITSWCHGAVAAVNAPAEKRTDGEASGPLPVAAVAVFPLRDLAENSTGSGLGTGLAEAWTTDLYYLPQVLTSPLSHLVQTAKSPPSSIAVLPRDALLDLARSLGLDYAVTGSYQLGANGILTLEAMAVGDGRTFWKRELKGKSPLELLRAGSRALLDLADKLGIPAGGEQVRHILGRKTASAAAFQYHAQGVDLALKVHLLSDGAAASATRAADAFRRAVEEDPWYAEAWSGLGWQLMLSGQSESALDAFKHALRLKPALAPAHIGLGQALVQSGAASAGIARLEAGIALNPALVSHHLPLFEACLEAGEYERGLAAVQELSRLLEASGRPARQVDILWWSAELYFRLEQFDTALAYLKTLLSMNAPSDCPQYEQVVGKMTRIADRFFQQGRRLQQDGRYGEAVTSFRKALEIDGQHRLKDAGYDYQNIGYCHVRLEDYDQARENLEKALGLQICVLGEWHPDTATTYNNLGVIYQQMGMYEKARGYFEQALAIRIKCLGAGHADTAMVHSNLGSVLRHQGLFDQAAAHFEKALSIRLQSLGTENPDTAATFKDLGLSYREMEAYESALENYEQALAVNLRVLGETHPETADVLSQMGALYLAMGDAAKAISSYEKSVAIHLEQTGDGHLSLVPVYENMARLYEETGDSRKALEYYGKALSIQREKIGADHPHTALNYQRIAALFFCQDETALARKYLVKALAIAENQGGVALAWRVVDGLSMMLAEFGQTEAAVFFGKRAVNLILGMPGGMRGPVTDFPCGDIPRSKEDALRHLAGLLLEQERIGEAREVIRRLKEMEYADFGPPAPPPAVPLEQSALESAWNERYEYLIQDQAVAEKTWEAFLEDLSAALADAPPRKGDGPDKNRLQGAALQPSMAGIQFLVTPKRLYILLTTSRDSFLKKVDISARDLYRQVAGLRRDLETPQGDPRPRARKLYDLMIAPAAQELARAKPRTLFVSLDGPLRYLPLAALYDGKHYLAENQALVVLAGGGEPVLAPMVPRDWKLSGFAQTRPREGEASSPGGREELGGILRKIHGKLFLDDQFTAEALLSRLTERPPVVHIASRVHLDPVSLEKSFMTLGDGSRLGLAAIPAGGKRLEGLDLVAFSACTTAMEMRAADGREIEGLGFWAQRLGARAVLATLWPAAGEGTSLFMNHFYRIRSSNPWMGEAEALRLAQVMFIRDGSGRRGAPGRLSHAHYWAPFILVTHWRAAPH